MKLLGPKISRQTMAETKASHAGQAVIRAKYLLYQDNDEKGGQRKINACGVEGKHAPNQRTDDAQDNPIGDGQKRRQHIRPFFIDIRLEMMRTVEGIIFIRQGIDEKIFPRTEGTEFFDEGQPIENMTAVEQE